MSPIAEERSDLPSPKRQKLEETNCDDSSSDDSSGDDSNDSDDYDTPEAMELFNQEMRRSGGFEVDFSKLKYNYYFNPVDLDDSTLVTEPITNRELMARLSKRALSQHNDENNTCLELGEILRANCHPSAGVTFYISFEVKDPSDGSTKPYRAIVRHMAGDIEVYSCYPKPSSSSS